VDIDEEEASRIRKSWFQHIFNNIERLTADLYSSKESFKNKLSKVKEVHYALKDELKAYVDRAIEKVRQDIKDDVSSIQATIKAANDNIKSVENKLSNHEIQCISDAKVVSEKIDDKLSVLKSDLDKKMDSKIMPMTKEVWLSKGKIAVWATVLGLMVAAAITYFLRHP
jgi:paraquat-inducible protein B